MPIESMIAWIPIILIAAYLPLLIRLDLNYREIPHETWIGMFPWIVATGFLYFVGFYPIECMWIGFAFVLVYFVLMKLPERFRLIEGADFILLSFISLFVVVNPISGRVLMPIVMMEMLCIVFIAINLVVIIFRKKIEQFPMIPAIAIAFGMTVMLG